MNFPIRSSLLMLKFWHKKRRSTRHVSVTFYSL
nr:MAG TPA: hypothetical protein [Bacteriophage sp.]